MNYAAGMRTPFETWYDGEEAGTAVAEVSRASAIPPAVFRPFYRAWINPAFDDYSMNGRTYRYF